MNAVALKKRKVCLIDIANDKWHDKYNKAEDPRIHRIEKVSRGPLNTPDWMVRTVE